MRSYKDINGVEHTLQITLGTRRKLVEALKVDLLQCATDPKLLNELLTNLATDPEYLLKTLAVIEGTTAEALEAVSDGTTNDESAVALVEAIVEFFPESNPIRRTLLDLMSKAKAYRGQWVTKIGAEMQRRADGLDWDTAFTLLDESMSGSGELPASAD